MTFHVHIYFIAPLRTNVLLLGTDDSPERGTVGRTDTIILGTIVPLRPYFQTSAGAQVLAPDWKAINPLVKDMFRR